MNTVRILGIDPGVATIGWSIIEQYGAAVSLKICNAITTEKSLELASRLIVIYEQINKLIKMYTPTSVAIEQLFFAKNVKTAIDVAQARGVILLCCSQASLPVVSYSPLAVKKTLTGDGSADKRQVQFMLTKILKLEQAPKPDDVADAVAIALTHAYTKRF